MYWPTENPHTEQVLRHLADIGAGRCDITDEVIANEADADMRQILVGLLVLHEDLLYAQELHGKAEAARAAVSAERERLLEERQRAITARDDFLAMASHELRTPLSTLELQVGALSRTLDAATSAETADRSHARARDQLAVVRRQVARMTRLVAEMLDVSRIATGHLELHRAEVDLGELVGHVVERFGEDIARRKVEVTVRSDDRIRGEWDSSRIDQVITNLLSNALKYGAGEPVTLTVTRSNGNARLDVTDHGIGISEEDQRTIFAPFKRAAGTWQYGGLGVGLWICRQIVSLHGGTLSVVSRPHDGARFTAVLPCR
jgi:signal transduction histidine kinase